MNLPTFPSPLQYLRALLLQPKNLGLVFETLGRALVVDDREDLGWGSYTREQRPEHKDTAPNLHPGRPGDHPLPFHHWQLGAPLQIVGQGLQGIAAKKPGATK